MSIVLIVGGFALLLAGGELLVRGASAIAQMAGISPAIVGLTVVSLGTSMPELVVSVDAALAGSAPLAVGNVVGSNIFNIAAILGIAALIRPLRIAGNTVRLEWPIMLLSSFQLYLLARDGELDRLEGGFFALALVAFLAYVVRIARRDMLSSEAEQLAEAAPAPPQATSAGRAWLISGLGVAAGCGVLAGGAHLLVEGAVDLARVAGVSETVIGLTVVAAGTSLPELATSAMASLRGRDDIAVANVIGSNIFNVLGIAGIASIVHPLAVPAEVIDRDALWMMGLSLLLFPLMRTGMRINRVEGAALLGGFAAYLVMVLA